MKLEKYRVKEIMAQLSKCNVYIRQKVHRKSVSVVRCKLGHQKRFTSNHNYRKGLLNEKTDCKALLQKRKRFRDEEIMLKKAVEPRKNTLWSHFTFIRTVPLFTVNVWYRRKLIYIISVYLTLLHRVLDRFKVHQFFSLLKSVSHQNSIDRL